MCEFIDYRYPDRLQASNWTTSRWTFQLLKRLKSAFYFAKFAKFHYSTTRWWRLQSFTDIKIYRKLSKFIRSSWSPELITWKLALAPFRPVLGRPVDCLHRVASDDWSRTRAIREFGLTRVLMIKLWKSANQWAAVRLPVCRAPAVLDISPSPD